MSLNEVDAIRVAKMPPAMRATVEQASALCVAELQAQKKLAFQAHRDGVKMLHWGAAALAIVSSEVAHHEPNDWTHRLLELLARAAIDLRDAYAARLQKHKERKAA